MSRLGSAGVFEWRSRFSGGVVADLEEPFHGGEGASTGLDPEARKGRDRGRESEACTLVRLNMQNGLEEPLWAAERTF